MASEYRVVSLNDTFEWPGVFEWPAAQRKYVAERLEELLNEMSREGWELVAPHTMATTFFVIFRRDAKK
jgi:hypothetical protein